MLLKQNRLAKKKDFENVFKKGRGAKQGFLFLKFIPSKFNYTRFAFVVSQKVSKKAVQRNKIRRYLREMVRTKMVQIKKGFDCVLVVFPGFEKKGAEEALNILLKQAKLLTLNKVND